MADAAELWSKALPEIRMAVTGVGVWTALNAIRPIALEENVLVVGLPRGMGELAGHLKMASTKRAMDIHVAQHAGQTIVVRVIEGETPQDWELAKRKDVEARRLQEQSMAKMRKELESRTSWEQVYEQISRRYAAVPNKSLPQNRARFYEEAVELMVEARKSQPNWDDLGERNFARCIERVAQYADVPATITASIVLQRAGEL